MLLKCGIESEQPLKLKSLSQNSAVQVHEVTSVRIKSQSICAELLKYAIDKDQRRLEILMLDVLYYSFGIQDILSSGEHVSISEKLVEQVYRLWQKTKQAQSSQHSFWDDQQFKYSPESASSMSK